MTNKKRSMYHFWYYLNVLCLFSPFNLDLLANCLADSNIFLIFALTKLLSL